MTVIRQRCRIPCGRILLVHDSCHPVAIIVTHGLIVGLALRSIVTGRGVGIESVEEVLVIYQAVVGPLLEGVASDLAVKLVVFSQVHALTIVETCFSPELRLSILNCVIRFRHIVCLSLLVSTRLSRVILAISLLRPVKHRILLTKLHHFSLQYLQTILLYYIYNI